MTNMLSAPWGVIPVADAEWLGEIGCRFPLDGYLLIMGQRIAWPKNNTATFTVIDYENEDYLRLKSNARSRRMKEWKLRRKLDIIAALKEWDRVMQNTTPVQE